MPPRKALSRQQLLAWVNQAVDADYPDLSALSDGIAYCQILDAIYPAKVPLYRLIFDARRPDEKTANLRLLAEVLQRCELSQDVLPVSRLAAGRLTDHIDLLFFLYDLEGKVAPSAFANYPAYERRESAAVKADKGTNFSLA